jgi:DNA-binding NarL/FixJ family response regulator
VARVLAFVPDLLFGSNVVGAVRAAGHDPELAADLETVRRELPGADLLIVDLTADAVERIEAVAELRSAAEVTTLAFYSHVEADIRTQAEAAGFSLVVPRSRMAREGSALITRLLAG